MTSKLEIRTPETATEKTPENTGKPTREKTRRKRPKSTGNLDFKGDDTSRPRQFTDKPSAELVC
ncbi:MAG: hypothetical protein IPH31_02615 [Lewinellaceae bacterium]|nr:hypothetical protein [Lewinellaceae bacterium]